MYAGEPVTQLQHALQSAQLAEQSGADTALIVAALLHDLGHMVNDQGETPTLRGIDDRHEYVALPFLRALFDDAVLQPIRLHVDAKRYLCARGHIANWELHQRRSILGQFIGRLEAQPRTSGRDFYRLRGTTVHFATARRGRGQRAPVGRRGED